MARPVPKGLFVLLLALLAAAACARAGYQPDPGSGGSGGQASPLPVPEGPFGDVPRGQGCDPLAHECVEGLFCLPVSEPPPDDAHRGYRCVVGCNEEPHCQDGRCFRFFGSTDSDDPRGFCGSLAGEGEACNTETLAFCSGGGSLVCYPGDSAEGVCRQLCDPAREDECPAGMSCADFFSGQDFGLCVVPSTDACDQVTTFCGRGETCTVVADGQPGRCLPRCDPAAPSCPAGTNCAAPFADPALGVCVETVDTGGPCAPDEFRFCAATDVCVDESGSLVCRRECTADPASCAELGTCAPLPGDPRGRSICAPGA